jgi:hypothetical protein
VRLFWFLSTGTTERGPVRMEDVDLENRIFRDHRLPVQEQRTQRDLESRVERRAGQR